MDAFEIGRATERERLGLLLETRRSMLSTGRGSTTRIDEINAILGMIRSAETPLDDRLQELSTQFRVPRHRVISRAIGAA